MIIVKMQGGLGNQFFQYALGRRLSLDRKTTLKLDLSWYATQSSRSYQLDRYRVHAEPATRAEVQNLTHKLDLDTYSIAFRLAQRLLPAYRRRSIYEQRRGFDPNILQRTPRNAYLDGYWQSENYFDKIGELLHSEFRLIEPLHPLNAGYAEQICSSPAVSLHVRRGDYLNSKFSRIYHLCDESYYRRAMDLILNKIPQAHFYIFSDDMDWVKHNLASGSQFTYVENNEVNRDWETVYLMSQCRHHIIANSSFSWWGAWLCENPEKMVIAPEKWFIAPESSDTALIPDSWSRI